MNKKEKLAIIASILGFSFLLLGSYLQSFYPLMCAAAAWLLSGWLVDWRD